jgi:hypothetical protein
MTVTGGGVVVTVGFWVADNMRRTSRRIPAVSLMLWGSTFYGFVSFETHAVAEMGES